MSNVKKPVHTDTLQKNLTLCTTNADTIYVKNYLLNKRLIKAMAEYCKEKGIQFMLVTIDTDAYIPEVEKRYKAIDPTFDAKANDDPKKPYLNLFISGIGKGGNNAVKVLEGMYHKWEGSQQHSNRKKT